MDDGKPVAKPVEKPYPSDGCPMSSTTKDGSKKRKRSLSAFEFAHVFAKMHASHGKPTDCPAFEDGCAFKKMRDGSVAEKKLGEKPLKEVVSKCPAFTVSAVFLNDVSVWII